MVIVIHIFEYKLGQYIQFISSDRVNYFEIQSQISLSL